MKRFATVLAVFVALLSISIFYYSPSLTALTENITSLLFTTTTNTTSAVTTSVTSLTSTNTPMNTAKTTMSKALRHAKITPHLSGTRGHSDHGWLNTYHSFSFADWYHPDYNNFGSLRVLNEDRVAANSGFPTHPHRDFEIFSYILSGELTHRDSMLRKGAEGDASADKFYRMHRGDVQFTTGGTGIAHSEFNEHNKDTVHFLQIWALPWKRGLPPNYHTKAFPEEAKREAFVNILSPLKAGPDATVAEEKAAEPSIPGTIPIHADFTMGAGIIAPGKTFEWTVGQSSTQTKRKVFVHLPMTKGGNARIKIDGREDAILSEGDGAFVEAVNAGDKLAIESVGDVEAEVIMLDTA
ncbi:RmlC-like cupin domain-containing protein [Plectosphaerella plurivora]|uniref:RmlC-like cupin domain-containing protein n=1 Tax=Plectosphaerella plurivora TaxID=936078 RepID=A0A9P8VQ07_9PEZI|nr:RmlC-like cupin domain-containing protein [Plectosphaerella plurivora]